MNSSMCVSVVELFFEDSSLNNLLEDNGSTYIPQWSSWMKCLESIISSRLACMRVIFSADVTECAEVFFCAL